MLTLAIGRITFKVVPADDLTDAQIEALTEAIEVRLEMGLRAVADAIQGAIGNGNLEYRLDIE